jgi:hypothetical protein
MIGVFEKVKNVEGRIVSVAQGSPEGPFWHLL